MSFFYGRPDLTTGEAEICATGDIVLEVTSAAEE